MPGLLDGFKQIQQPRQKTGKSLLDLAIDHMATNAGKVFPTTEEMNANLRNVLSPEVANSMLGIGELNKEAAKAYEDKMKNIALAALTVYHGSPHKFDKFDMSKIGTGEGAQAYGHGLYFAESPGVAKSYQDKLARIPNYEVRGTSAKLPSEFKSKIASGNIKKKDLDAFAATVAQNFREIPAGDGDRAASALIGAARNWYGSSFPLQVEDMLDDYARTLTPNDISRVKGALYKVDIPDESIPRMLDWDKPLSEQRALAENLRALGKQWGRADLPDFITGGKALNMLGAKDKDIQGIVSYALKQQGIPGIRYLDGMSRGEGQGSYNYVLFDDQLPRILEINGVPTGNQPWMPGEFQGLLGR